MQRQCSLFHCTVDRLPAWHSAGLVVFHAAYLIVSGLRRAYRTVGPRQETLAE
jgi:hypothetical protein